ncbi:MAG: dephospho-CoA kinase [Enterocloster citroniae]|nr:dephospho-CoA kinase [Enterocloster citroniae]
MTDQCRAGKFMLGITGGVGSGKSRILAILKEDYGFHVIQADQVAKDLMQPGMESYLAVVGYLGPSVLLEDKSLDRAAMAEIIFHDPEKRRGVDERTHPLVWKAAMEEAMAAKEDRVVIAAALPSKEFRDKCSEMWYVYTSRENRIKRLGENRGYTVKKTLAIMENQVSEETFRAFSDAVIDNNGTLEETRAQIQALLEHIF